MEVEVLSGFVRLVAPFDSAFVELRSRMAVKMSLVDPLVFKYHLADFAYMFDGTLFFTLFYQIFFRFLRQILIPNLLAI